MKPLRLLIIALLFLGGWAQTSLLGQEKQQSASSAATFSGTEYFVSFPLSDPDRDHRFMGLMITSEFATTGTVEIPEVPTDPLETITSFETRSFEVRPGNVTMIEIPRSLEPDYPGEANHNGEASERTVRLTSRAPVSVTVINARQGVSGAYPVLPVDKWGTQYMATILPATPNSTEITNQMLITAAFDDTEVVVYPSTNVSQWNPGEAIRFRLNRNQTWLLQANALPGTNGSLDLSGTTVDASKPVGVVAAHRRAALSDNPTERFDNRRYSAWHATMQMPTETGEWGKEYFATPLDIDNSNSRFRLIALQSTSVQVALYDNDGRFINQKSVELKWPGQIVDVTASSIGMPLNGPTRWSADKRFMVTQIKTSGGDYPNPTHSPELIRLVPTDRYASRTTFGFPKEIGGASFNELDLRLIAIATGNGNPFENLSIDGMNMSDLSNSTISKVTGNYWSFVGSIAPGGHTIAASNGVRFTGNVRGNNGEISGVSMGWELSHWSAIIEADLTPPSILAQTTLATDHVQVEVTDRTPTYFSGVDEISTYDSPGWERIAFNRPLDPDLDARAEFKVKKEIDPSGPLTLLLRDRDGNKKTTKVHDGVCLKTAYPDPETQSIALFVGTSGQDKKIIRVNANPCGDEASINLMFYDLDGTANEYLEAPTFADGGSTPHPIAANGSVEIEIRTKPGLRGQITAETILDIIIDGQTHKIPISLEVDRSLSVNNDKSLTTGSAMQVSPNPFTRQTSFGFTTPLDRTAQIEIINTFGTVVKEYSGFELAGSQNLQWDGKDRDGNELGAGLYVIRLTSSKGTDVQRVLLVR